MENRKSGQSICRGLTVVFQENLLSGDLFVKIPPGASNTVTPNERTIRSLRSAPDQVSRKLEQTDHCTEGHIQRQRHKNGSLALVMEMSAAACFKYLSLYGVRRIQSRFERKHDKCKQTCCKMRKKHVGLSGLLVRLLQNVGTDWSLFGVESG